VDDAKEQGANVIMGGIKSDKGDLFYKPTILSDITPSMECFKDEIFGPVVSLVRFKTEEVNVFNEKNKKYKNLDSDFNKTLGSC
jgi:acyl-CoA reductase-like NAD-dependent aldehyde dehydrogenase